MDYISNIQRTLDFIESNIQEDITLDELAFLARFSKFHYHRIFAALVGYPVMEYLRNRRLTVAAVLLSGTRRKIFDIAINCGFNSQAAFNRAFMRANGITPGDYRSCEKDIVLYEPVKLDVCKLESPKKSYFYGPEIAYLKKRTVVGILCSATYEDNIEKKVVLNVWSDFLSRVGEISNCKKNDALYGAVYDSDKKNYFEFMASAEVGSIDFVPDGMEARVIGGSKYAVFTYSGVVDTQRVFNLYNYIYRDWLMNSVYAPDNLREAIEILDSKFTNSENSEYKICIPVC